MTDAVKAITGRIRRRCGDLADLLLEGSDSASWQSLLFDGGRHRIAIRLGGDRVDAAIEALRDEIAAPDFEIPGHVVAEINITAIDRDAGDAVIRLDALTIQA